MTDIPDNKNPGFMFQQTDTALLVLVAQDEIDPRELALRELAHRGLDHTGNWVGFEAAQRIYEEATK